MKPKYDLDKIKFSTDEPTFNRAVGLYESGKVRNFKQDMFGFSATVIGTHPYEVYVSAKEHDAGTCTCYLGQNDALCKHMVAVAIQAVTGGSPLSGKNKQLIIKPMCSSRLETLNAAEIKEIKAVITVAMRYIKPYNGPSHIWFAYQNSLMEGCNRLSAIVSKLPVSEQTAKLLVNILLRLDKKLCTGGVDDSNGTVGGFIEEAVQVLEKYAKLNPSCVKAFHKLKDRETCFGWEEPLVKIHERQKS